MAMSMIPGPTMNISKIKDFNCGLSSQKQLEIVYIESPNLLCLGPKYSIKLGKKSLMHTCTQRTHTHTHTQISVK